jgi:hypothetical protein
MTNYGVTGPDMLLTPAQAQYVRRNVKRNVIGSNGGHKLNNKLVSGMAYGIDTEAVMAVWGMLPMRHLICTVPGTCLHNQVLVERAYQAGAEIVLVPNEHTVGETYMARNDATVDRIDVLLAFPRTLKEVMRSGTWATVRRARKAGVKVRYYPLDRA